MCLKYSIGVPSLYSIMAATVLVVSSAGDGLVRLDRVTVSDWQLSRINAENSMTSPRT